MGISAAREVTDLEPEAEGDVVKGRRHGGPQLVDPGRPAAAGRLLVGTCGGADTSRVHFMGRH